MHVSDECFQVSVHLRKHGETITALRVMSLSLGLLVNLRDCGLHGGLTLANPLDVLLILAHLGLFVLVALSSHLAKVGLASLLDF